MPRALKDRVGLFNGIDFFQMLRNAEKKPGVDKAIKVAPAVLQSLKQLRQKNIRTWVTGCVKSDLKDLDSTKKLSIDCHLSGKKSRLYRTFCLPPSLSLSALSYPLSTHPPFYIGVRDGGIPKFVRIQW